MKQTPRLVEMAEVAGVHQPAEGLLAAAARVALEDEPAADEHVADLARGVRSPVSSRSSTVTPSGGRPTVPGAARRSAGVAIVAITGLARAVAVVEMSPNASMNGRASRR